MMRPQSPGEWWLTVAALTMLALMAMVTFPKLWP